MSKLMFRSEVDVIPDAYQAILETTLSYQLHTNRRSGIDVLAFSSYSHEYTTRFLNGEFDLVQSENLLFVNSLFFVNKAAVELFQQLGDDLKELENKHINTPLIITGSGLGGYLAILSTLRLHHAIDVEEANGSKKTKRPICITFGSPLVGDDALQRAVAERETWKSSILNVVAKEDHVACFFSSNTLYKPFGTFLFCTESGGHTAFEDQDSILRYLDAMKSKNEGNLQVYDYVNILNSIRMKDISKDQIWKTETKLNKRKKNPYDPRNEVKISLTYMEWYMKTSKSKGGYYESYKNAKTKDEIERKQLMMKHKHILNKYWKKAVEDKKEDANLRKRWLYSGNNYRKIVEPLDIAEHYRNGKTNYIMYRSDHYKLLEKWLEEDTKDSEASVVKRNKPASLSEDSCFHAHVEEALIALRNMVNGESIDAEKELELFEVYVMREIKDYAVSPDIFLEGSSLSTWWNEYKAYKGTAYASEFAQYMNSNTYESYQ